MPHRTIQRGRKVKPIVAPKTLELNFDVAARQDYLTGFTKRKQARIAAAREAAVQRDRNQRVIDRQQLREKRQTELKEHVAAVKKEMRQQERILDGKSLSESEEDDEDEDEDGEESWEGIDAGKDSVAAVATAVEDEAEYTDEEKYTTVTVEAMGKENSEEASQAEEGELKRRSYPTLATTSKGRDKSKSTTAKPKKKKFRYENKAERAATRQKQKSRNAKAAKARKSG